MALNSAVLSWNANTEPDLAGYTVYWGRVPGVWLFSTTSVTTTITLSASSFTSDGKWYFAIDAYDSSGNHSAATTPVSKRIVRVKGLLRWRR